MAKRTYSRRDRLPPVPYQNDSPADDQGSCKRHKTMPSRSETPSSISAPVHRRLKSKHSGPISFSLHEGDADDLPKEENSLDTALSKFQSNGASKVRSTQGDHNSQQEFEELVEMRREKKARSETQKTNSITGAIANDECADEVMTIAPITTSNERPGMSSVSTEATNPLYEPEPNPYMAEETPKPAKNLLGRRIALNSNESKLWFKNQTNSLFLRLPGEIRNRVYAYALGGGTIKIGYLTYRDVTYEHEAPKVIPVFKYFCTTYDRPLNPFRPYMPPYVHFYTGFTLVNSVCRQLYLETAVLPFKLNKISFQSYNTMFNFLIMEKRLSRQQREAITELTVPDALPQPNLLQVMSNVDRVLFAGVSQGRGWYRVVRDGGKITLEKERLGLL